MTRGMTIRTEDRRLSRPSVVVPVAATTSAAAAALVLLLNKWTEGEWFWPTFWEDLIRNTFIGTLLALATWWITRREAEQVERTSRQVSLLHERERVSQYRSLAALAGSGWSKLFEGSDVDIDQIQVHAVVRALRAEASDLRDQARGLVRVRENREIPFDILNTTIAGTVARYIAEGRRLRRYGYLQFIADRLSSLSEAREGTLVDAVNRFQLAFVYAAGWRRRSQVVSATQSLILCDDHVSSQVDTVC